MSSADDPASILQVPELTPGAQRILEVASELFYRRGIHAVGVDTIAAESGITKRTLYDRFGSKDTLVAAYLQSRHHRWWGRTARRLADAPGAQVLALFDSYTHDAESTDRGCAFINAAGELPSDHPAHGVIRAHKQAVLALLVDLVRADDPEVADPEAVADEVFLLLEGAVAHRGIDGDDRLLRRARTAVARLVGEGRSRRGP